MARNKNDKVVGDERERFRSEIRSALLLLAILGGGINEEDELFAKVAPPLHPALAQTWATSREDFDTNSTRHYVYGPTIEGGSMRLVPAIACVVRRSGGHPFLNCHVLLMETSDSPRLKREKSSRWLGGWRFECPEWMPASSGGSKLSPGAHDYYHVQAIVGRSRDEEKRLRHGDEFVEFSGFAWSRLDTTQPAFPLAASGPFELVMAMLVSLYSLSQLRTILGPHLHGMEPGIRKAIDDHLEGLEQRPPVGGS